MIEALRGLRGLFQFEITLADVDSDPALERRLGEKAPVLMHGGHALCHHRLATAVVTAYLAKFR